MKITFIATTLTRKGRFGKGDVVDFPADEAKELQRLSSVESPAPTIKKTRKSKVKKVENEPKDIS